MLQAVVLAVVLHSGVAPHHPATAPRKTPTPAPQVVTVANEPGPDYLMYGLTGCAILISIASTVFAGLAWKVSRRDYALNQDQANKADAERAKKPNLVLSFAHSLSPANDGNEGRYRTIVTVYVANYGTAPANNIHATLSFPANIVEQDEASAKGIVKAASPDYIDLSAYVDSFGNRFARVHNREMEVLPGEPPRTLAFGCFVVSPTEARVLWHIKCREGEFPGGNQENATVLNFGPTPAGE